ncbi:Hypothetical predicted protein [Mytilus galloprovincialis]|uniref:Helix-turn-helix domain-containing protein n=1 Tax=Mytilus galloprovincialis TaxID=29158 RepID=A0A8B6H8S8_MYTGA|nr:Hypothetical predicted protein [Mytilus galloprovincialis]
MPFLDILVIITEENKIVTDIFSKDTDTHMYLNFYSNHPKHVKLNIPFNLASRIITITSTDILRNKRLEELKVYLKKQHYPEQVINYGIQKALTKGPIITESRRSETTDESSNNLNKIIPFITTYNPRDYDIFSFMRQIETNLHKSERMDKVLQKKKIINSKRQSKSLKRYLTSSKFDFNETVPIVKKCTDKRWHGSTYVRWGRTSCAGSNGELIYSGYTAGQYYKSPLGGPANTLCLPNNPEIPTSSYTYHAIDLYGTEYETNYFRNNSQDEDMPCALCRNNGSSSSVMIPGRRTCYAGWNMEYTGMLAAGNHGHSASNFICVDNNPEYILSGKAGNDGHLMYVVNTKCGPLPCPPYEDNRQVYCVVCSK